MKKNILLAIALFAFTISAYAQANNSVIDSTSQALKTYLSKNIKFPAVAIENYVQGTMVAGIHLNSAKMIDSVWIVRSLGKECDQEVITRLKRYVNALALSQSDYTIGLHFVIQEKDESAEKIKPFNQAAYKNFLFELNITAIMNPTVRHVITY